MTNKTLKFKAKSDKSSLLNSEQLSSYARQLVDFEQILLSRQELSAESVRICNLQSLDSGKKSLTLKGTEQADDCDATESPHRGALRLIRSKQADPGSSDE